MFIYLYGDIRTFIVSYYYYMLLLVFILLYRIIDPVPATRGRARTAEGLRATPQARPELTLDPRPRLTLDYRPELTLDYRPRLTLDPD